MGKTQSHIDNDNVKLERKYNDNDIVGNDTHGIRGQK